MQKMSMRFVGVMLLSCTSCFIPPKHEKKTTNEGSLSRPIIDKDFVNPPLNVFSWQQKAGRPAKFTVGVNDSGEQTIYGRMFIDWEFSKKVTETSQAGKEFFSLAFTVDGLCDEVVKDVPGYHELTVAVSDSGFVDSGKDLSLPKEGGGRDAVTWRINCLESTGVDGGI
jgi:hypothetical protein